MTAPAVLAPGSPEHRPTLLPEYTWGSPGCPLWVPVLVVREDGKPCICYAPHDADCTCALPT